MRKPVDRGERRRALREAELLAPGLVHEMRQPLMGIDAGLKLLARDAGAAVTSLDAYELVRAQVGRLAETLQSYEELMDPGRSAPGAFELAPVVQRAVELLRFRLRRLGERFALTIEPGAPVAFGAPGAVLHAVTNLVVNAYDALDEAGGGGRLEVRVLRGPRGRPEVRVADEGVGIPADVRHRIFEAGFTTKPGDKGTGLGLSIARRMLRACGGELRLVADDDPARRAWARTELAVELASHAADAAPHAAPPPRATLRIALARAAVVLVAGGLLGSAYLAAFRLTAPDPADPPAARAAPAAAAAPDATVLAVEGALERQLPTGGWTGVPEGARLRADDTIRTGARARARLAIGAGARLSVAQGTQLTVRELTDAAQTLRLSRGLVTVDQHEDGSRVLVVESEGGDAVAKARASRFSVLSTGAALAVATESGAVRLESAGRGVDVPAGQASVAFRGAAPRPTARIPVSLLLKVANAARPGAAACAVIDGAVSPGSEVTVDGEPVATGPDGRFSARVPRRAGVAFATVTTRDPAGRIAERRVACAPDPEHDVSDFAVRWGDGTSSR